MAVTKVDESPAFRWALAVCATLTIAPLYLSRHPPFCDLPEHVAAIATLRHYWDPSWDLQRYFVLLHDPTRTPYLLYDAIAAVLAVFFGSAERANLLLLSLVGLGFPYALRALLAATHRDVRLAVIACPLFWNGALGQGLLTFVAAIPVTLFALASTARQLEAPKRSRAFFLAALTVAIFYLHFSTFVLLVVGSLVMALAFPAEGSVRVGARLARLPRQLGWLVPGVLAVLVLYARSSVFHPNPARDGSVGRVVRFRGTLDLLRDLPTWSFDFWRGHVDDVCGALLALLLLVLCIRVGRPQEAHHGTSRAAPLLFLAALALYFTMPHQVGFAFILDQRLAPIVALLTPLLARPARDRLTDALVASLYALAIVVGGNALWQMRAYDRNEAYAFDHVLRGLPRGKKLLTLMFDPSSEYTNINPYLHFGSFYSARFGGVSSFSFVEVPHWPVQYRPEAAPPKKEVVFWDWNPCLYRNTIDGPYYDFVLTRGAMNPFDHAPAGPTWRIIGQARDFTLFEKSGELPPSAEPDRGPCTRSEQVR